MAASVEKQLEFIRNIVVKKIIENNEDLKSQKLLTLDIKENDELNGFMSNIVFARLDLEDKSGKKSSHNIVVKLMKGSVESRNMMKSIPQFSNEIAVYQKVIPTFLQKFKADFKTIDPKLWTPRAYLAEVGKYPELSELTETILVTENVSPEGFKLGGRTHLTPAELKLMTKAIAQYHACNYALKILEPTVFEELKNLIIPLPFINEDGKSLYSILYEISLSRPFAYLDAHPEEIDSPELKRNVELLRSKYGKEPLKLMMTFLRDDAPFTVILHGDYNRNNVLFRYDDAGNPIDLRMIDYQECRYASPAFDLAFFFYMNIEKSLLKSNLLEELFKSYHDNLIKSLCELLKCNKDDPRIEVYQFDSFLRHFKKFALYGAMVSLHFLPWMCCPEEECDRLANLWFSDMTSPEFRELAMTCGGKPVNERLIEVLRLATRLGHMDILQD